MNIDVTIQPTCTRWMELISTKPQGCLLGRSLSDWRRKTREELGLATDREILATGHQALLWHPGILIKYMLVDAMAQAHGWATANLIVDQHAEGFGDFDIPMRRADGSLMVRRLELCRPKPRPGVPMGLHEAFTPPRPPSDLSGTQSSVREGVKRIFEAVYAHRTASNAALQMAAAIADLMQPWVKPLPNVTATNLINTTLARSLMQLMIDDPWRCAACYNRAVQSLPEAGVGTLLIRDDYVELPLWRIRPDGRRMRAYDNDLERVVGSETGAPVSPREYSKHNQSHDDAALPLLLPRALFMTALVRLGMCDLFIHGTGGGNYDRAMERWIRDWLGIDVGSIAVATATMHLPLLGDDDDDDDDEPQLDVQQAMQNARKLWHDPEAGDDKVSSNPGPEKRQLLAWVMEAPRRSSERRARFVQMHERLATMREQRVKTVQAAQEQAKLAQRQAADALIAMRRDWAFPLYPASMLDQLAAIAMREAGAVVH